MSIPSCRILPALSPGLLMGFIRSRLNFGITVAGEFSPAFLDCGLFVNGVNSTSRFYQGDCSFWDNYKQWGIILKSSLSQLVLAQMDALGDYFFFTWKVGDISLRCVRAKVHVASIRSGRRLAGTLKRHSGRIDLATRRLGSRRSTAGSGCM